MTHEQFQKHMDRLANSYPKGAYPPERVTSIGKMVMREQAEWWDRAVTQLIDTCRQAPMRADINDLLLLERERTWSKRKHQPIPDAAPRGSCSDCKGVGLVMCAHKPNVEAMKADEKGHTAFAPYAFKCDCDIGRQDPRSFPTFDASAVNAGFYRIEVRA